MHSQAQWIWSRHVSDNQSVRFRCTFELGHSMPDAVLYITVDNFFTVYVNGHLAGHTNPDSSNGEVWQTVQRLEIGPYLTTGKNTVAVVATNVQGAAGLLAQLRMDGRVFLESSAAWKVSENTQQTDEWKAPAYDDSGWEAATREAGITGGPWGYSLHGWPGLDETVPYLFHIPLAFSSFRDIHAGSGAISGAEQMGGHKEATISVVTAASPGDPPGFVADFGQEIAGRVVLVGLTPGTVTVGTGESYEEAMKSPWHGMQTISLLPGSPTAAEYSAFRFAHIVFPQTMEPQTVRLKLYVDHKYYPVAYKGSFDCSDPLLTKLWYTGAYTSHLCMQEDIWDAPKRDRARWVGDLNISGEVINNVFADKFLMEHTLDRLRADAQGGHPAGDLPAADVNGIPGYSAAYICTLADFHRHIGDYAYLKSHHDDLISLLKFLRGEFDSNGIFVNKRNAWAYTDWSPGFDGSTSLSYATTDLFMIRAVHEAVYLLEDMGDHVNAAKYAIWEAQLREAALKSLPADGTYGTRLQENAMAVYSGTATAGQRSAIYNAVLNPASESWDRTGTPPYNDRTFSPYYGNYILQAMAMTGHTAAAEHVLRTYWGGMLDEGATTFWEAYDPNWPKSDFHNNLYADGSRGYFVSLCHGWSSGPTNFLTERVLGIRSTGAGFCTAIIAPDLGDLQWAEGAVPTPRGLIHERVESTMCGLRIQLTLPPGTIVTVSMPSGYRDSTIVLRGPKICTVLADRK